MHAVDRYTEVNMAEPSQKEAHESNTVEKKSEKGSESESATSSEARLAEIVAELAKTHAEYEDKLQVWELRTALCSANHS